MVNLSYPNRLLRHHLPLLPPVQMLPRLMERPVPKLLRMRLLGRVSLSKGL